MGVGKTTTGKELQKVFANSAYLDGDWCWSVSPFIVTEETKGLIINNIGHLLKNYLTCSVVDTVILSWVMNKQEIVEQVMQKVRGCCHMQVFHFSLVSSPSSLTQRLQIDIQRKIRHPSIIDKSLHYLQDYQYVNSMKINTDFLTPREVAIQIAQIIENK